MNEMNVPFSRVCIKIFIVPAKIYEMLAVHTRHQLVYLSELPAMYADCILGRSRN